MAFSSPKAATIAMGIYRENSRQWAVGSEIWPIFITEGGENPSS